MKMKMSMAMILIVVLTVVCVSTALAEAPIDPYHEASDYFKQTYVLEGDLDDESIPVVLLGGIAVLTAVGAVVVHRKCKSAR